MGSIDGWVDPEIQAMQNMIHGALDASFEDRNRAKEGQPQLPATVTVREHHANEAACLTCAHVAPAGKTSFGGTYYQGPTQRGTLTFKLYALSGRLELPRGASKEEVVKAMKGKVLGELHIAPPSSLHAAPAHCSLFTAHCSLLTAPSSQLPIDCSALPAIF